MKSSKHRDRQRAYEAGKLREWYDAQRGAAPAAPAVPPKSPKAVPANERTAWENAYPATGGETGPILTRWNERGIAEWLLPVNAGRVVGGRNQF